MDFNFISQILNLFRRKGIIVALIAVGCYFLYQKNPELIDTTKPYMEKYSGKLEEVKRKIGTIQNKP